MGRTTSAFGTIPVLLSVLIVGIGPLVEASAQERIPVDSRLLGVLEARYLGPAATSGRITSIDGVALDPRILYVGSAGGGVWKTTNGGNTFNSVFDDNAQSIGAVRIDQAHPDTVWVGTGEPWVRNSVSIGDGVYRTTDGGKTWKNMGLEKTERIARIVIDPRTPSTVFVAALGHLWNDDENRGVYRTTDGGSTWERVLYVDEGTGCADIAIDPENPGILYAAMWQFRRTPWSFSSGGSGSGLYRSTDGGKKWAKVAGGLPTERVGRIAVAVAPSKPEVVYALVESAESALYRSTDRGATWERRSRNPAITGRPFYFASLTVDPKDPDKIYKPDFSLVASNDGGETFYSPFSGGGNVHSDLHAVWVDPINTNNIAVGTDGGLYTSSDKGGAWRFIRNLPVAQFYHVSVDMAHPYNVYGGLQDNGSWAAPSQRPGGIENAAWQSVGWGDGFCVFPDPIDRTIVYAESQGGNLFRRNRTTGETKDIQPTPAQGEPKYRFNWNTPVALSPTDPKVLYVGSQFLHRSTDRGESWARISEDLTTNDPAKQQQLQSGGLTVDNSSAENHCTIFTIAESPLDQHLIWVGTDDGNVQVTEDGGGRWRNVAANVPGLPPHTWCSCIEPGRFDRSTAYATFDGHAMGDMRTYIYRTTDLGKSWTPLATDSIRGYAHVVRQDPVSPNLLFVGTEFGLFLTLDGGLDWGRFSGKVPPVSVRDIVIHPRDADVILATHGRGVLVIDDITPLRQLSPEVLASPVAVLGSRPSVLSTTGVGNIRFGDDEFTGENPSGAAVITYYLRERHIFGDLKLEVLDSTGAFLSSIPAGKRKGINRAEWAMQMKPPHVAPTPGTEGRFVFGPTVAEGKYLVRLIKGKDTVMGSFTVVGDPNSPHSAGDRAFRQQTVMKLYAMQGDMAYVAESIAELRDDATGRAKNIAPEEPLATDLNAFADRLDSLYRTLVATSQGRLAGEEQLRERVIDLYSSVNGYGGRPSESQLARMKVLESQIVAAQTDFTSMTVDRLKALNARLREKGIEPMAVTSREEFDKRQ